MSTYSFEINHHQIVLNKDNKKRKTIGKFIMILIWVMLNVLFFAFWKSIMSLILNAEVVDGIDGAWVEVALIWIVWQILILAAFMEFASSTHDQLQINTVKKEVVKKDDFLFFDRQKTLSYVEYIGLKKSQRDVFIGFLVVNGKEYPFVKDNFKLRAMKKCSLLAEKLGVNIRPTHF